MLAMRELFLQVQSWRLAPFKKLFSVYSSARKLATEVDEEKA
jgi:hypothetical protein